MEGNLPALEQLDLGRVEVHRDDVVSHLGGSGRRDEPHVPDTDHADALRRECDSCGGHCGEGGHHQPRGST